MPAVAFSPDGATLAFAAPDGRVKLLDPATGRGVRTLGTVHAAHILGLAYSPDGTMLAVSASDGTARLWNADSGRESARFEGHVCCVNDVAFSPDGRMLATSSKDHTAKVWATRGNVEASALTGGGEVTALAFSSDGSRVLAGSLNGPAVAWTVDGRSRPAPFGGGRPATDLALSPDGKLVALTGADTEVRVADAATGRVLRRLEARAIPVAVAFDARGRLAAGGPAGVTVFAADSGETLADASPTGGALDVAFAPRGETLAIASDTVGGDGTASLWKLGTGFPFAEFAEPNPIRIVAFSPDGRLLAGVTEADTAVKLWDVARRREVRELYGHTGDVTALTFSPDGRLVATASRDRTVRVWDPRSGRQLRAIPHDREVTAVAFSADGRRLATGDDRGVLRTWDACDGCFDPRRLLALARERVTRRLSPVERRTFLGR
jgi:WD40 repeat protein